MPDAQQPTLTSLPGQAGEEEPLEPFILDDTDLEPEPEPHSDPEEEVKARATCSSCLARTYRGEECVCENGGDAEDFEVITDAEVVPDPAPAVAPAAALLPVKSELRALNPNGEVVTILDAPRLLAALGITDLADADAHMLAIASLLLQELHQITGEAQNDVSKQIVRVLDRRRVWTVRDTFKDLGLPGGYEFKSPSPEAGTKDFDDSKLLAVIQEYVRRGVIEQEAADRAMEPVHHAPEDVTYDQLREVRAGLAGDLTPAAVDLLIRRLDGQIERQPKQKYKRKHAGVQALIKGADEEMKAAILACQVTVTPPDRKATVKRTTPDAKGA